jgi:hypothetical protein
MPGVLEPDCRVKPEVRSFTRLESKLAGSFHFYYRATLILWIKTRLRWNLHVLGGGNQNHPWRHDPPKHTALFQPGRTVCVVFRASPLIWPTPYLAQPTRPGRSTRSPPAVFRAGLWVLEVKGPFSPFGTASPFMGYRRMRRCRRSR